MISTGEGQQFQVGLDGFHWWIGVVVSLADNLKLGRMQVRIIGWHEADKTKLSNSELPWALALAPVTQSNNPPNVRHGDWVVGFFLDGKLGQQPIVMGVLPAIAQPQAT